MRISFYKDLRIVIEIENVYDLVKCSTGDVVIRLKSEEEITIKRESFDFFGVTQEENKEDK